MAPPAPDLQAFFEQMKAEGGIIVEGDYPLQTCPSPSPLQPRLGIMMSYPY
jgi:hypothetical protein